jgi:hypothetical protein
VLHTLRQVVANLKPPEAHESPAAELGTWAQGKGATARAQYECTVVERAREVAAKAATGLSQEEVAVIKAVMRSVEELAQKVKRDGERAILEHLSDKMSPRDAEIATKMVLEASKCRGNDSKISKVQQEILKIELPATSSTTQLISLLIDPIAFS